MKPFFETLAGQRVAFIGAGVSHRELIPMFARAGAAVTLCDKKTRAALGAYADELAALGVISGEKGWCPWPIALTTTI